VPRAELVCGRVGDDGDGTVVQPIRPALRLLSGSAACMAASCCICMAWGIVPHTSVVVLAPCAMGHAPVGAGGRSCEEKTCRARRRLVVRGEAVRGEDLSCEAEACRVRRRLVVGIPLVGNWSEMQPTGRRLDVLPVWVLTGGP
jgi:hypothetical protein